MALRMRRGACCLRPMNCTLEVHHPAAEACRVRTNMVRSLLGAVVMIACCACAGAPQRARLLSDLRLELDSEPSIVRAGELFSLRWSLRNMGRSAVSICIYSETMGLRGPQGRQWPLRLSSTSDGCQAITLAAGGSSQFAV